MSVLSGVLQESVLGPLLFLVYINDMLELVKHFCKLFADDPKISLSIKTPLTRRRFRRIWIIWFIGPELSKCRSTKKKVIDIG